MSCFCSNEPVHMSPAQVMSKVKLSELILGAGSIVCFVRVGLECSRATDRACYLREDDVENRSGPSWDGQWTEVQRRETSRLTPRCCWQRHGHLVTLEGHEHLEDAAT